MYFRNYRLPNVRLERNQKSIASEYPRTSNMVNGPKHCWNLNGGTFVIFIDHCERNWVSKGSVLAIWNIWRLFVYTLTAYKKYSVLNREYLTQPIHMQLSMKTKDFLSIFFSNSKPYIKFGKFSKKDDTHSYCISEITNSEKRS